MTSMTITAVLTALINVLCIEVVVLQVLHQYDHYSCGLTALINVLCIEVVVLQVLRCTSMTITAVL